MLLLPPSTLQGHHGLVDVLVALIVWPLGSFFKIYIPCNEAFFFILKSSNFLLWLSVLCYKYQEFQIVFLSRLAKREDSLLSRASDFLPITSSASAESTTCSSCLPVFIYNFSNTFPLHLIHSSMV